jgi:hypothetical protein
MYYLVLNGKPTVNKFKLIEALKKKRYYKNLLTNCKVQIVNEKYVRKEKEK